jgi:predicted tellurium resistance membrane protein TerC
MPGFEVLLSAEGLISLATLILMEVVLGIDNIVFISILCGKLPPHQQEKARKLGLLLALLMRVALLFGITWIIKLTDPVVTLSGNDISWRDMILIGGGLFLLAKSTTEIHGKIEGGEEMEGTASSMGFAKAIVQIVLLDIVFSFDSILTAVGLVDEIIIMIIAVVVSMIIMLAFAKYVSDFVNRHPTVKMLALSFLLMIGVLLVAEGFEVHVPKGYIYFAMAFSLFVEMLNLRMRKKEKPVK